MAGESYDLHRGCARAREWVSLRIDAELSELERLLLRRHLSRCDGCRAFAESVAITTEMVRTTPQERPSRALEPEPRTARPRRVRYRVAAAAAVVMVGAGIASVIATTGGEPSPQQPRPATTIAQVTPPSPPGGTVVEPPGENV